MRFRPGASRLPARCDSILGVAPESGWDRVQAELSDATASRQRGQEGRARVCARRAAGGALALYWSIEGNSSAYQLLLRAAVSAEIPDSMRETARRLATRVTEGHRLPHDEDPLEDAHRLVAWVRRRRAADEGLELPSSAGDMRDVE